MESRRDGQWSLDKKTTTVFASAIVLLIAVGLIFQRQLADFEESSRGVAHTHEVMSVVAETRSDVRRAQIGMHNYVLNEDRRSLQIHEVAAQETRQDLKRLRRLTADNPKQQHALDVLEPLIEKRLSLLEQGIDVRRTQGFEAGLELLRSDAGDDLKDDINAHFIAMIAEEENLLEERLLSFQQSTQRTALSLMALMVLALGLIVFATLLVNRNIARRKQTEEALREQVRLATFSAEIGQAITQGGGLSPMLARCAEAAVRHLDAAFARIWTHNPTQGVLELQASAGMYTNLDGGHSRVPLGQFKIGLIAQERKPHLTNDVANDPRIGDPEWARQEGMVAFAGQPLVVEDRLVGVLALFARARLSEFVLRALASAADSIAVGIERQSAYAELEQRVRERTLELTEANKTLQASEERFHAFMDNGPAVCFIKDQDGRTLYVNEPFLRSFNMRRADCLAKTDSEVWPQETARQFRESDRAVLAAGRTMEWIETIPSPDGTPRHWMVFKFPFRDASGETVLGGIAVDVTDRRKAEEALLLRDRAIDSFTQGVVITDPSQPDNPIIYVNRGFECLTGYSRSEVLGRNCRFLQGPKTDPATVARIRTALSEQRACLVELLNYRKDGTPFWNALSLAPVHGDSGKLTHFVGVQTDVTPFKRLEEQFRQAQKMEAFGQLAGGVAHDFNNLLTIISGFSEMVMASLPAEDQNRALIEEVYKAGERAASLTRQLLAFSRKQVIEPKVLDLNVVVSEAGKMLRRLIGEDISLATVLASDLQAVKVDPGQIEQVIVNLVVNARDAMPQGGKLTIETANVELGEGYAGTHVEVKAGRYVMLAVSDTGQGMDEATKSRIFEPFFTTKEPGKGTGLGLATVYGIVKQSGGHVSVYSEPGQGATFKIYLPMVEVGTSSGKSQSVLKPALHGDETVLLVEDEPAVRTMSRIALQTYGYIVLEASQGDEAVQVGAQHQGPIHLLLTDVVMPGMSGRQVAEALRHRHPTMKALFVSGYTDDAVVRHGVLEAETAFLQKPFTPLALANKVREVLDG